VATQPLQGQRRCYVASPLGFNEAGRTYYYEHYLPALKAVVQPVDPWATVRDVEIAEARAAGHLRELWLTVGRRNLKDIATCTLLVAWLDGQEVDSGTAAEIGYAAGNGILCFGLRTDLRQAGEEGMAVNVQVEATIVNTGGCIVPSLAELIAVLTITRAL
jgi:nucleoside 2-deoxyribosyltransferase